MIDINFPDLNSKSAALFNRACKAFPGGSTRHATMYKPYTVFAAGAKGCHITDVDGTKRLDFVNNFSALIHGHAHPKIVDAVTKQIRQLTAATLPVESALDLAELLIERTPGIEQIVFGNSGTEAIMTAVKAARAYTGRSKIAKIEGGYHGLYDQVQHSMKSTPDNWGVEDAPNTVAVDKGTPQEVLNLLVVMSPNNVEASRTVLRRHADELAAVIVDPMPQRLLAEPLNQSYLEMLREETSRHGIVLVFDEVICLRAGYHGAQGVLGITPDLTAMGKIIGGGYPVGAMGGRKEIMSVFDSASGPESVFTGGTFSGNAVSMTAGFAAMSLLTPEVFEQLDAQGDRLRKGMLEAGKAADFPLQAKGSVSMSYPLLTGKNFGTYRESVLALGSDYWDKLAAFHQSMLNAGVVISPVGSFYGSTAMTDADIDFAIEAIYKSAKILKEQFPDAT